VDAAERPPVKRAAQGGACDIGPCEGTAGTCDRRAVAIGGDGEEKWGRHGCPRARS
jgi:hypothetical protein